MNRLLTKMSTPTRTVAVLAAVSLSLSACGAKVSDAATGGAKGSAAKCGTFNLAVNAWVGYAANAAVVAYLAHNKLGCTVKLQNLDEQISWQGFASGQVDAVLENWGHADLAKKYITEQKVAQDAGRPAISARSVGTFRRSWPRRTPTSSLGRTSTSMPLCSRPASPAARANCSMATRDLSPTTPHWSRT